MTFWGFSPIDFAASIGLGILSLSICVCFLRLWIGPSLPDRLVALDMIAMLLVGLLVLSGISNSEPELLRVAAVLALINFIATIGFALYWGRKEAA